MALDFWIFFVIKKHFIAGYDACLQHFHLLFVVALTVCVWGGGGVVSLLCGMVLDVFHII